MRAVIGWTVSAVAHGGTLAALLYFSPAFEPPRYLLERGENAISLISPPTVDSQAAAPEFTTPPAEPSPPVPEVVAISTPANHRPLDHLPTILKDVATSIQIEPVETFPPPPTPAKAPTSESAPPDQGPQTPPPREIKKTAEVSAVTSVAMPFQQAQQVGSEVDETPRTLPTNRKPDYPFAALQAGIQGRVELRVLVDATGAVSAIAVHASAGETSLDQAALATVRNWRFEPARRRGVAVPYEVIVPVRFSIRG